MNPFERWLLTKFLTTFLNHELAAFTDGTYEQGDAGLEETVGVVKLSAIFERSQTGATIDHMQTGMHFVNVGGELIGAPMDDTGKAAIETLFNSLWNSWKTRAGTNIGLKEYRWYHQTLDDPLSGEPTRVTTISSPVLGTVNPGPPQVAETLTLRTALRKHWGRLYLPAAKFDTTNGDYGVSDVDALATAGRTFLNGCFAAGAAPVVYSKTKQAAFSISAVEADSVPDIIRRRRMPITRYKRVYDTAS